MTFSLKPVDLLILSIFFKVEASSIVDGNLYGSSFKMCRTILLKSLPLLVFGTFSIKKTPSRRANAPTSFLIFALI